VLRTLSGQNDAVADRERSQGGRWHRFMLSLMGPAQVGPYDQSAPAPDTSTCSRCGTPWSEHEVVRTETRSYSRCPLA
jgi:hypothetical protein